jgi:hypothetical protein
MKNFHSYCGNKLPPLIDLRAFYATAKAARANEQPGASYIIVARSWSRAVQFTEAPGPASLLVHAQLAAHVRVKSAALAADADEKNESAGGVAESISSLEDFI